MGMCLIYYRVSPQNAKTLLNHPPLIHTFLDDEARPPSGSEAKPLADLEARPENDEDDTDKAWHAIHYLLTGDAEGGEFPTGFLLSGGQPVGNEDVGYGPARIFSPTEVSAIQTALSEHSKQDLMGRYDGPAMDRAGVYPTIWERDGEEGFEYAWENFVRLKEFIESISSSADYLLLHLC